VSEEIRELKRKAIFFQTDVTKKSEVDKAFSATEEAFGGLDICLNVAGVCIHQQLRICLKRIMIMSWTPI